MEYTTTSSSSSSDNNSIIIISCELFLKQDIIENKTITYKLREGILS